MSNQRDRERIRTTYGKLDEWRARRSIFHPRPGSELAADDLDWPPLAVTQVASSSLVAALDHLQSFRLHVEAGQLFSLAHPSLLRTALLSAAQAVWVLDPDDRGERVKRARAFALHHDIEHRKYLDDHQALARTPRQGTDLTRQRIVERITELKAKRDADGETETFAGTRVIEEIVTRTWGDQPAAGLEARLEWRRGSGAAHGLSWVLLGQPENQVSPSDAADMVAVQAGGDIAAYINLYFVVIGLMARAYSLLDQRGGKYLVAGAGEAGAVRAPPTVEKRTGSGETVG